MAGSWASPSPPPWPRGKEALARGMYVFPPAMRPARRIDEESGGGGKADSRSTALDSLSRLGTNEEKGAAAALVRRVVQRP